MINRELKPAVVNTYGGVDEYGQMLSELISSRDIEIAIGIYSQSNVNDPRYVDITHYGLTKDKEISDNDVIVVDNHEYKVKIVNNTGRWTQLFLC